MEYRLRGGQLPRSPRRRSGLGDWLSEAAEHYTLTLNAGTTLPDDRVLAVSDCTLKAKDSGIEITAQVFTIATVRDGVITRMDEYNSRPEALEAVGLSE